MPRSVRVNELVLRELSAQLHTRYRDRAVGITLTEVSVTPDLRTARVYYSVLGNAAARAAAAALFTELKGALRSWLGKRVVLKYTPTLDFFFDTSAERGHRTITILDQLETSGQLAPLPEPDASGPADAPA